MQKRAQISIFLLIGTVLLVGLLFFVYTQSQNTERQLEPALESPKEILPVKSFVESCLQQSLSDGIEYVSMQGGFYNPPEFSAEFGLARIPYYYSYERFDTAPTLSTIESELGNYLDFVLPRCTNDFQSLSEIGFVIESEAPKSSITISKGLASAEVQYPIQIKKEGVSYELQIFTVSKESQIDSFYNYSTATIKKIEENPDYVPLSYIMDSAFNYKYFSEIIYLDNGTVVFSIIKNTSLPSLFSFAVKYNWNNLGEAIPFMKNIPELNATIGYRFTYQLNFSPKDAKLTVYTSLFNLSSSGKIDFTPTQADSGLHSIVIKVQSNGRTAAKMFRVRVLSDNNPPILIRVPNQIINAGQKLTYRLKAINPDNDTLFYSLQSNVAGLSANLLTGSFEHTFDAKGVYNITAIVVDIKGAVAKQQFKVIVK